MHVQLRLPKLCLSLRELCLCLIKHCLKRSRIDFEQHLILGNQRAFPVILFDEIARDLRLDLRVYIPIKRCDPFVVDRDVSLDDLDDLDVWRRSGRCRNVLVSTSTQQ